MTHALTRVLSRRKIRKEPEYLPPYFWHRASTWWWLTLLTNFAVHRAIETFAGEQPFLIDAVWVAAAWLVLYPQWSRNRQRWISRTLEKLCSKLDAYLEQPKVDQDEVFATLVHLAAFTSELGVYASPQSFITSLSVRVVPWDGDGSRFIVYSRRHPKRVYTFYHD